MSKHKLFKPDAHSPLSLGMTENMTIEKVDNKCSTSKTSNTPEQGLKRKNSMITPVAKKITKKNLDSDENHPALLSNSETPEPSTSKDADFEPESSVAQKSEKASPDSLLSFIPDDDFDEADDFFSKLNQKLPYTYQEDEMILKFVFKGQNVFRVSSLSLWKNLEGKKDNPKRTYQSLKNRFLRNIKPNLFTTYKHLIPDQSAVEKILIKFPELKRQAGSRKFLSQIKIPELEIKIPEETLTLNSDSNECKMNTEQNQKEQTPSPDCAPEDVDQSIPAPPFDSLKSHNLERAVKLSKNIMKITVNLGKSKRLKVPLSSWLGLSERFKKLKKNNERVPCPTCGRFYRRPVSNDSSESDAESDILIPNSVEADKNSDVKSVNLVSNKSPIDVSRKMSLRSRSRSSLNPSGNRNAVKSLEKTDKSDGNSEGSNGLPEEAPEKDEVEEIIEVVEVPVKERISEVEDKTTDNDSDIDLIYEHTVARFHKLIDANEEKILQKRCLNKDRDSIGFKANAEKNLDSFFLETPLEVETPALTKDYPTQVKVNSTRRQSQRVTRSSALASNMIKMLAKESKNVKKLKK